jgi:hypothetical protein
MPHVDSVSTSMVPSSTSIQPTLVDDSHVNHNSHSHDVDSGFTTPSSTT